VDPNIALPLASSGLAFVFALFLLDQWLERRRPYQLVWALGMTWYGIAAGTELLGSALGWSEPLYRTWYMTGAVWVAAWLGLGTMLLLGRTRFGYAAAVSVLLAGLFTYLTQQRYQYAESGLVPVIAFVIAAAGAIVIAVETYRGTGRWPYVAGALVVGGSIASIPLVMLAPLAAPGYVIHPGTGIPTGELFPGSVRLLTPFFNITGGFALALGALYSTYSLMPKRRVLPFDVRRGKGFPRLLGSLPLALAAFVVNLVASVPGAAIALLRGKLHSRVPATILIAIGGFIPAVTSGMTRFGETSAFFLGEFLGVLFLFAGFLVSIEVFREIRIPFTHRVLRVRHETA
jgi:hypothetical protein